MSEHMESEAPSDESGQRKHDSQQVEVVGRGLLIAHLMNFDIGTATPYRDRGIDLIAYRESAGEDKRFQAKPIQLKCASQSSFSIHRKYATVDGLLMVFVWNVRKASMNEIYVMTYDEAVGLGERRGYTKTRSWIENGVYSITRAGDSIVNDLAPYKSSKPRWYELLA